MPYREHSCRTWIRNKIVSHHSVAILWLDLIWYMIYLRNISLLVAFVFFLMIKESIGTVASLINPCLRLLYKKYSKMLYLRSWKLILHGTHLHDWNFVTFTYGHILSFHNLHWMGNHILHRFCWCHRTSNHLDIIWLLIHHQHIHNTNHIVQDQQRNRLARR